MPRQVDAPIDPETYVTSPQLAISTNPEETPATPASNNTEPTGTQTEASGFEDWRPVVTATPPPVSRSKLKTALLVFGTVVSTAVLVWYLAPPELFKWPKAPAAPPPIPAITLAPGTALPEPGIPFRHPLKSGGFGPEMVVVPPGQFQMGSPPTEVDWSLDEGPIRQVTIARFAIGVTEITLADWQLCVKQGQCPDVQHEPNATVDIDDAIQTVSWQDAQSYVTWLNSETGANYRLPSESEFEYAARAGTDTAYWWGNRMGWDWANCYECSNKFGPAKTFPRNNWALYGTAGYPWEWVQDCYVGDYADAPKDGTARELDECTKRTLRGVGRSADRYSNDATSRKLNGFRVAQSLNSAPNPYCTLDMRK
ncbi:MAG: SUMF1/EgtB/PvdO family nonheme iron enzyme [Ahniella sp.]|nr:SUMF1/EgtB/PvdO family nonheme iron enzyme [Ahniella sp.]